MILIHRGEKHYVTEGLAQICSRGHDEFPVLNTFNTDAVHRQFFDDG